MPDYGRFCPVSLGSDVFADRWTPLIVRELILGNTRFNDIVRGLPGISRSLLVQRLKHLERAGVLTTWPSRTGRGSEYHLTPAGKDLEDVVMALGRWAVHWMYDELRPHDVDPITLTWWMHRRVDRTQLPEGRVVVQFDHTAPERKTLWMVIENRDVSVCIQHPGFESDLLVVATTAALSDIFNGLETWERAVRQETIKVLGDKRLAAALPKCFIWSPFAPDMQSMAATTASG